MSAATTKKAPRPRPAPPPAPPPLDRWLVAGDAAYRVVRLSATTIETTVDCWGRDGSLYGRRVVWPRAQVAAAIRLGELAFTRVKPEAALRAAVKAGPVDPVGRPG